MPGDSTIIKIRSLLCGDAKEYMGMQKHTYANNKKKVTNPFKFICHN